MMVRLVVFSFESVMHSVEATMQQAGDLAQHLVKCLPHSCED